MVPSAVLAAFGLAGPQALLPGGQGEAVRVGHAVVKPVHDASDVLWSAAVLEALPVSALYRVVRPLRSLSGELIVDGWQANVWQPGRHRAAGEWPAFFLAARAFHRDLAAVAEPGHLARRGNRWAVADRVAWGEAAGDPLPQAATLLASMVAARVPLSLPSQVVHGDLCGNMLLEPGLPPLILDFSPYFRPVGYAEAIAVVDSLLWWEASPDVVSWLPPVDARQLLLRALIFRLMALSGRARATGEPMEDLAALDRLFDVLVATGAGRGGP